MFNQATLQPLTKELALQKAKISLMTRENFAFFCTVAFSFQYQWDETIDTACVDGTTIFLNPAFFMSLQPEERAGLIVHESLHPVFFHLDRIGERDPDRWNIAADHVINIVIDSNGLKLPPGGYLDHSFAGLTTEQVYNRLPDNGTKPNMPDLRPKADPQGTQKAEIEGILVRANMASQMANDKPGSVPGELVLILEKLLKPKLPWNILLRRFLTSFSKTGHSWKKPNRRYFPDMLLPSRHSYSLSELVIFVDISGSVSSADFSFFVSEIRAILKGFSPPKITLVQFDTQIKRADELRSIADLEAVKFSGRGGTKIQPVIDWANKNKPKACLVFSDGHFSWPPTTSAQPFLWLVHGNTKFKAPFGKVVHYDIPKS